MLWNCVLLTAVLLLTVLAWHASRLTRTEGGPAPVYLLFDPRGYEVFGTWGPKMVFYRVSREATARWGKGSVVVAALSRETITQALQHGRFVVLLCHGREGRIATSEVEVALSRAYRKSGRVLDLIDRRTGAIEPTKAGDGLQLLYNSGCKVGVRSYTWGWQQRLAPTEVIVFGRATGGLEHLWWIWAYAPERLRAIRVDQ